MWSWEDALAKLRAARAEIEQAPKSRAQALVLTRLEDAILWALVASGQVAP